MERRMSDRWDRNCHLCGSYSNIQIHHVYGNAYRKKSTQYGMVTPLCISCHTGPDGVHLNHEKNLALKRDFQRKFEETHSRDEFRRIFGKSYIMEDEE